MTSFPDSRLRRLRGSESMRNMVKETRLTVKEFVYPLFVANSKCQ
jgi:delta-aminolevulinic acid dehydratase/porphobilinogen synthase